jgi:hypothetical protein
MKNVESSPQTPFLSARLIPVESETYKSTKLISQIYLFEHSLLNWWRNFYWFIAVEQFE